MSAIQNSGNGSVVIERSGSGIKPSKHSLKTPLNSENYGSEAGVRSSFGSRVISPGIAATGKFIVTGLKVVFKAIAVIVFLAGVAAIVKCAAVAIAFVIPAPFVGPIAAAGIGLVALGAINGWSNCFNWL